MQKKDSTNKFQDWWAWLVKGNNRVKFFFFVLSVFLWFLIKLSRPGYINEFQFPLSFTNLPQNKLLVQSPNNFASLTLRGDGFILLKYALTSFKDVEVDLSSLKRKSNGDYYWLPPNNNKLFSSQLADGVQVVSIDPDTLTFNLSPLAEKKIPIKAVIKIDAKLGQKLYQTPQLTPDSIVIAGPQNQIDKISFVETQVWTIKETGTKIREKKLALNWLEANEIRSKIQEVSVKVDLASITEETQKVPITVENVPDSLVLEIFPKQVQIRYRVALRDYDKVKPEEFAVVVNFQELKENPENRFLTVTVDNFPPFIEELILDPKRVEFIVTAK